MVIDSKRSSFEKVNLLSSWRKNTFVGATLPEDKECLSWITDTKNIKNNTIINVIIDTIVNEELKQIILFNNESDYINLYDTEGNKKGIVDFKSGKISLNFDTTPPIENSSNITIQFCYESEESSFIKNAKLSVLFGGSGDANRLFLSDGTNKHIWSEMNDFSYFPDTNYDILGSESSNIVGYVKGSDGLLLAFKEKNGNDSTIYYITGTDTQKEDSEGNKIFDTIFTKKAGNSNDTIINKNASVNLNGDNLILTQNGIKGVVLQENITTNEYIIQNRSKNIDSRLLQHNLKNAIGFVFKNKYYLAIDNVVYVCDSKFKFQSQDDINNSFNYEWWYLTNIDAQVFCEINNELFFGTSDGNICKFQKEDFEDKKIIEDNVSINFSDNKIIFPSDLKQLITENNTISFYNDVYALHLDSTKFEKIEDGKIYVCDYDFILKIFDGLKCYISNTNENDLSGLDSTKEYEIRDIDLVNKTFSLYLDNTMQKPNNANFSLYKKIDKKELYISLDDCDSGEFKVKEYLDGEPLILSQDIGVSTDLKICIYENKNVVSKWFTSINDFGTNMYSKTLLKLTISTEPMNSGKIQVGYKTKNLEKYVNHKDFSGFSFDNLNFNNFSFEGSFTSSNTFRIKERNFNFMVLRFISDTNSECAVNGITLLYKINNTNKGVR
ncbi:MAG: hypothetical protein IJW82_07535 [Clostridia bacterium]|nr:hypothetical protein [Clostridia bacterium]